MTEQKKVLICFGDEKYQNSQIQLAESAFNNGFDLVYTFKPSDIEPSYFAAHKEILSQPRGAGYWLWKPYFMNKVINELNEGDILVYADCGITIINSFQPVFDLINREGKWLIQVHGHRNGRWVAGQCYMLLPHWMHEGARQVYQVNAAMQGYKVSFENKAFIADLLNCCEKPYLITDLQTPETFKYPEFEDHRHDQAILSLLAFRNGFEVHRDPSQFGMGPEELANYPDSTYNQLVEHHRRKN